MIVFIQLIRYVRLVYTQFVGWARMRSEFDYTQSRCTRGSFVFFAISTAVSRRCSRLFPRKFDPFDRFIPYLLDTLMRSEFDYAQSHCTRGSFVFFAISMAISRRCSHSFLNRLDRLDRVMANLLVGFLLGATTTTSRVVALGAVAFKSG
jgi:hypothetical protein